MTALRVIYASLIDLRTDEAYYWTWSKENVLSFLDHPPMIAWFIRFGTAIFGDTNFGVRFAGILAMLVTQLLLADIVRRITHDVRAVVIALLLPEAALYYGLLMAKVSPDVALIPFAIAMVWALIRLWQGGDARWWLAAGVFAWARAVVEIHRRDVVPGGRGIHAGAGLARALAALALSVARGADRGRAVPAGPDLECRARLGVVPIPVRAGDCDPWMSLRTVGDFIGLQFGLVGFILLPVVLSGLAMTAWRGYRRARCRSPSCCRPA